MSSLAIEKENAVADLRFGSLGSFVTSRESCMMLIEEVDVML